MVNCTVLPWEPWMTASALGTVVISRSRAASMGMVATQRPVSQLANGILRGGTLPTRNSIPGGMFTPVGVCMMVTICLLLSTPMVHANTIWLVFCCAIC